MVQIQVALRANFQGAKPPGYPRRAERPGTFSLFTFLLSARQRPVILSEIRPPPRRASPGNYSLFIIHYSFFICLQGASLQPCPRFGPLLFFSAEKKRSAPGWRRRRGFGANEDGPVLRQDGFVLCGKRMQVWYKPECPLLLFPLPLPWCAPHPWLPLWGSWHGVSRD